MPRAKRIAMFNASCSTPNGGTIVSYTWNFGDGNVTTTNSSTIIHQYLSPNRYNVTLTVLDTEGLTDSVTKPVKITHLADINMDGHVDVVDLAITSAAFGSYPGHPRWKPDCDINSDKRIDISDVAYVSRYFGWHDP
jgi:PKD repeat protein